jgi:uncharacterized membrane protein YphA (DoxX/SURF4 family)
VAGPGNELGSAWAANFWIRQAQPPQRVLRDLESNPKLTDEQKAQLRDNLAVAYSHSSETMPESLQYYSTQLAVAWGELLGGLALVLGCLTRLAALLLIVIQLGAIATVTWARGFSFAEGGGYEYNVALIGACAALVFLGGGALSLDRRLAGRRGRAAAAHTTPAGQPAAVG